MVHFTFEISSNRNPNMKYDKQDQQGKPAFNERVGNAKSTVLLKEMF
jgi:hypothetical protein